MRPMPANKQQTQALASKSGAYRNPVKGLFPLLPSPLTAMRYQVAIDEKIVSPKQLGMMPPKLTCEITTSRIDIPLNPSKYGLQWSFIFVERPYIAPRQY
jgi:hypothetical protein